MTPIRPADVPGARGVDVAGTDDRSGEPLAGTALVFADGPYVHGLQVAREGGASLEATVTAALGKLHARVAGAPAAPEGPGTGTGDAPFPDAGEQALLARVPEASRGDCERTAAGARAGEATSSVRCRTAGLTVYYEQFATADDMRESYDGSLDSEDIERGAGTTCDAGAPAEGTWDGDRVACWENAVGAWVVWTHADLGIVSVAVDTQGDLQRLVTWWESPASGPVPGP